MMKAKLCRYDFLPTIAHALAYWAYVSKHDILRSGMEHSRPESTETYPMPGQGSNSGATYDSANFCPAVCRLHELVNEHG